MDGARTSAGSSFVSVAQTVDSVGPYALKKSRPSAHRATISFEQLSPAEMSVRSSGSPADGSAASAAGVNVAVVIARSRIERRVAAPSNIEDAPSPQHSVAPVSNAITVSHTDASKLKEENCRTRLPSPTLKASLCAVARLLSPSCASATPFGTPVEPEV